MVILDYYIYRPTFRRLPCTLICMILATEMLLIVAQPIKIEIELHHLYNQKTEKEQRSLKNIRGLHSISIYLHLFSISNYLKSTIARSYDLKMLLSFGTCEFIHIIDIYKNLNFYKSKKYSIIEILYVKSIIQLAIKLLYIITNTKYTLCLQYNI